MTSKVESATLVLVMVLAGCSPVGEGFMKKETQGEVRRVENRSASVGHVENLSLDATTRDILQTHGSTIKAYSRIYGFDWRLILAVMKAESRFDAGAESSRGAIGLMQIMPTTGEEVGKELEIDVAAHPGNNIHAGV